MKNKKGGDAQLWGMMVYEIIGDGCMNGLWTNTHTENRKVMNEIARKKKGNEKDEIAGEYYVSWIEEKGGPVSGALKIESRITHYYLEWIVSGKVSFRGVGIQVADKRLVVTYWDGEELVLPLK